MQLPETSKTSAYCHFQAQRRSETLEKVDVVHHSGLRKTLGHQILKQISNLPSLQLEEDFIMLDLPVNSVQMSCEH